MKSVIIFRLGSTGTIQGERNSHDQKQRKYHNYIASDDGSVPLNTVFTEEADSNKGENKKDNCQGMLPAEAVCTDGSDQIIKKYI